MVRMLCSDWLPGMGEVRSRWDDVANKPSNSSSLVSYKINTLHNFVLHNTQLWMSGGLMFANVKIFHDDLRLVHMNLSLQ